MKKHIILSVEDSEADFLLIKKALEKIEDLNLKVINVNNGKDAIDFLNKKNKYSSSPAPDMIILDLNIPVIQGLEVLKTIKKHKKYKSIPVVIYSTSKNISDIQESYENHANSYINKGFDLSKSFKDIDIMGKYWLKTVVIPKHTEEEN